MQGNRFRPVLWAGILILLASPGWGHGNEQHRETAERSPHMEEMYRLKRQIPVDFQVMDRTPVTPNPESLGNGSRLYQQHCAVCHGPAGRGNGPAAKAMTTAPADFLDLEHSAIYGPGEKYWIIGHGTGRTGMPGFSGSLSPKDRWDLVNHLYRLQGGSGD